MRWPRRDTLIPLALGALAFVVAFAQRPGLEVAETKVDLHVAPGSFLRDVLSAWTPSGSLGHVFAGQYGGYLWPMGPFFALGHLVGLPDWIVGRLWIGTALALSAWGMVRLLDALAGRPRGAGHLAGALLYMLNPYVVTYVGRTSITLLATAALPWLLLCVHRGLRDPRGLWWPAAFALVLTSTGGGVNVAVTAWLLLAPALLVVYELGWGAVAPGAARAFVVRLVPVAALASLWWVAAVLVHARYGLDFLPYTEQPGTIWSTTSLPESLRLLGFWTSYIGVGYTGTLRAFQADAGVYLGLAPVVVATLAIPALCLGSFALTRRARYAPFFLALVLLGLLVMFVGFPEGAPLRRAATFTYNHVQAVRFLRTSYKAGPLVSLGLAGLGALAVYALRPRLRAVALVGAAVLVALACWPLARGAGLDRQLGLAHGVPAAWRDAAHDLDRTLPRGRRAMVLPGQLFAFYDWGGTYDPILPALTDRPVATRFIVPFADLRAVDLQWTTDALVSQQRALPGQLRPLLDLMGVGAVVQGADDDRARSGAVPASSAAGVLDALGPPARAYGPQRTVPGAAGTLEPAARLAQVRRWSVPTGGMVRVLPRDGATVVDGSAAAIADLAAFGALRTDRALHYAADLTEPALRAQAARGASFVISDSNRRRVFVAARLRGNTGWTVPAAEKLSEDSAQLDPFPRRGTDAQTVALVGGGVASVRADFSPGFAQFPERRPFAAIDGDPSTAWLADRALATDRHHLDIGFTAPRNVDHVDLMPYSDGQGRVDRVAVNGRQFAVRDGWNRLHLGLRGTRSLSVRIAHVTQPPTGEGGAGGIRELRIPGVRPTEALRPPVLVEHALHGADVQRSGLTYLFDRTTGDDPAHPHVVTGARSRGLVRDQQDGERGWARAIAPPAARTWRADAWAGVAPETPDHVLDAWTRSAGATTFDGSSRFEGLGGNRASSAFDGDPARAWIAGWIRSRGGLASVAHGDAADDPHAAPRARAGARALPDSCAGDRGRPPVGAAGGRRRRHRRPAGAAARPHGAHRDPRRRLPERHARYRQGAPRRRPGGGDRRRCAVRRRQARRRRAAPCVRRRPGAPSRRARGASARGRDPGRHRRRPPAAGRALRPTGRAARRAGDRPRRRRAVAPGPRAARVAGAGDRAGDRRRACGRSRTRRPRRARRRARGGERPQLARARRVLRPRLARALRRALARAPRPAAGLRQRVAGGPRLSRCVLRLRSQPRAPGGRRHLADRVPGPLGAARPAAPARPRGLPGAAARRAGACLAVAPRARSGPGRGARARLRLRPARGRGPRSADLPRPLARRLGSHAGAAGGRRPARRRARPARGRRAAR